jgi:hypothetical protein
MKKIFLLLTVFSMVFTSCEPLEDINTAIENQQSQDGEVADIAYKLSDDDYTTAADKGGLGLDKTNFTSIQEAKDLVPAFLALKYPFLGATFDNEGKVYKSSSVAVTYNFHNPVAKTEYTVSAEDYTAISLTSLNSSSDFNKFFEYKFPSVDKGSIVDLTYKAISPKIEYTLKDADYDLVGNGRYNNFDIRSGKPDETVEARRVKIQTILKNNYPATVEGQEYLIEYAIYDGAPGTRTMSLQLNASGDYDLINSYTLVDADYDLVGNGRYNNFDIRSGKPDETEEARRAKMQTILLNNFPSAITGDQYLVSYAIYDGASGTKKMLLKFNGTGYDLTPLVIVLAPKTTRFALADEWKAPFTLVLADYEAMGQTRDNFSGRDAAQLAEANRLIEIYLGQKNPFAAKNDFIAVQYNAYKGSGVTAIENVNFVFDGDKWHAISEVIETITKFGHNGTNWVPDNTIKYTLTAADFDLVGNGRYNNFDVRSGKDEEKEEARRVKINTILLNNFPNDAEGQKYTVSYAVYDGAAKVFIMKLVKTNGAYVLQ